jgi:hypothetical protein
MQLQFNIIPFLAPCNPVSFPFNMSDECHYNQWEKQDICLMTESMKFLKVHGKNIIQN